MEFSRAVRSRSERRRASASAASAASSARSTAMAPWSISESTKRCDSESASVRGSSAATPARLAMPCSGQKVQAALGRVPVPAPAASPCSQAQRAAAMSWVASGVISGAAAAGAISPASVGSRIIALPPVAAESCSASAVAASSFLAAAERRRLAASSAVMAAARRAVACCWSRTRPAKKPVTSATARKTNSVRMSVGEPITNE